jgi:3-(3-hydroxy-phenyl)propionate hydroxylase
MAVSAQATYDVAIVGYGPVGATFANLLSSYGLTVAVVERSLDIYDKPRAIVLDHEVLRVFQACGLASVMEQAIAVHPGTQYLGVDGEIIFEFKMLSPPYPLGWTPNASFVQPELEYALRQRLSGRANTGIFLGTQAVGFDQDQDSATLHLEGNAHVDAVKARYLVGCDGANSFVRKGLDVGLTDLAFDELWMVVDAWTDDPTKRPNKCFQYCWPSRPGTYVPGPGKLRRWEIKLMPGEEPELFSSQEAILKVLGGFTHTSDLTIWRSAVYRFHALLARQWRLGRVFLMGDAAHQMPPFLGQGLSGGIRDAFNLAWKIRFVLAGHAGDNLLDTYQIERAPHVGAVVKSAKELGEIIGELDPIAARSRDIRLRAELQGGRAPTVRQKLIPDLQAGLIASGAKLAGALFVQPFVFENAGNRVRLDDLLKPGFAVVTNSVQVIEGLSERAVRFWHNIDGEFVVVGTVSQATDAAALTVIEDGTLFADWLTAHEVVAVIVRPDRYVFGAGAKSDELNELLIRLEDYLSIKSGIG